MKLWGIVMLTPSIFSGSLIKLMSAQCSSPSRCGWCCIFLHFLQKRQANATSISLVQCCQVLCAPCFTYYTCELPNSMLNATNSILETQPMFQCMTAVLHNHCFIFVSMYGFCVTAQSRKNKTCCSSTFAAAGMDISNRSSEGTFWKKKLS